MKSYKLISVLLFSSTLLSCTNSTNIVKISAWGNDVSSTLTVLESGLFNGEKYDYVASSYPVISSAMQNNSKLSIFEDIANKFSSKYDVNGFPQAGLFINKKLEDNTGIKDEISSFLSMFDSSVEKLLNEDKSFVDIMNKYSTDLGKQTDYFGFNSKLLNNMLQGNKMAFISNKNNPSLEELNKVGEILEFTLKKESISSYYLSDSTYKESDYSKYKISVPFGAPAASLLPFIFDYNDTLNNNILFTTLLNIRTTLLSGNQDFVIFDSLTGMNISDNYKLVRLLTYGNLHLISLGNDSNNSVDSEDKIYAYGQELIPGKVVKSVYEKE